jgi:hypothetical protein
MRKLALVIDNKTLRAKGQRWAAILFWPHPLNVEEIGKANYVKPLAVSQLTRVRLTPSN